MDNKKKTNTFKLVSSLIAILAVFCIVFLWDNLTESQYPLSVDTNGVKVTDTRGDYTVKIDNKYSRLLILKNGQVTRIIEDNDHYQCRKMYRDAIIRNEKIYVLDVQMRGHTQFIEKENIVVYDLEGNNLGSVYEIDYGEEILDAYPPRIVDYDIRDNYGAIAYVEREDALVKVATFDLQPSNDPGMGKLYELVDFKPVLGDVYIYDGCFDIDTGLVAVTTLYGDVYASNRYYNDDPVNKVSDHNDKYALSIYYDDNAQLVINSEILNPDETVNFSFSLAIKVLIIWLSIVYLVFYCVIRFVFFLIHLKKKKEFKRMWTLGVAIGAVATILIVCVFYSYSYIHSNFITRAKNVAVQANNIANMQQENIKNCITDFTETGQVSIENYQKLYKTLTVISENYAAIDESASFNLYYFNKNHDMYLLLTSGLFYPSGLPFLSINKIQDQVEILANEQDYYIFDGFANNYLSSAEKIYDNNGELIGCFSAETSYDLLIEKNVTNFVNLFFILIVVFTSIFLLCLEIVKFIGALQLRKKAIKLREKVPEIHLSRIIIFCIMFASEVDSSLMVLIARDMLSGMNTGNEAFLISLPAFVHSAGMVIGVILFILVTSKLSLKRLGVLASTGIVVFYLLTAYAVYCNNFVLYLIFKFLALLCLAQIFSIPNGLITHVESEKTIAKISVDMTVSALSAGILGMMFAGYIAEYVSDWCIYVMAAIPCILVIVLCLLLFSKSSIKKLDIVKEIKEAKAEFQKNKKSKNKNITLEMIKFYFSKNTITFVLFIIGTTTLTFAYRTYIFPLLGSEFGWDKATISNITVMANIVVFVLVPIISNVSKTIDYWKIVHWCMLGTGLVFVILLIRQIPATAIFVMIVVTILNKLINSYMSVLLVREAEAKKVHKPKANVIMLIVRDVFAALKAPVASGLLTMGISVVYGAFAIGSFASGAIFSIVTRNSAMHKSNTNDGADKNDEKIKEDFEILACQLAKDED